jgi:hypothetical protein
MQDALAHAAAPLDELPETAKLTHLWRIYTTIGIVMMLGLFSAATYALRAAILGTIREEVGVAVQEIRTNISSFVTDAEYRRDQEWRERFRTRDADELKQRVTVLERTAKETTESLHRIEVGVAEISGKRGPKLTSTP